MKISTYTVINLLLIATSLFLASCSSDNPKEVKKENPIQVTVAIAGKRSDKNIQASGQIESKETALISTRVMGFITSIHVKPGDLVQKGKLLVTISNDDILAKRAQAQAMVSESQAALKDAQKDYERYAELYKQQSASTKEFENATLHYNSIKAKAQVAKQMQNEAEAMLAYTNLTAPFSGVITQKNIDVGSMANPGMPILIMEQAGSYQVHASVSEADISKVKKGTDAEVVIKSTNRIIKGKVSEVSPSSQFSGGRYMIKINIPEAEMNGLYGGMYVNAVISAGNVSNNSDNAILVPISAIIHNDQLTGLYTISESQTALLRWVKIGKAFGDQVEILSGLSAVEKFIVTTDGKLYNGVPITIK